MTQQIVSVTLLDTTHSLHFGTNDRVPDEVFITGFPCYPLSNDISFTKTSELHKLDYDP